MRGASRSVAASRRVVGLCMAMAVLAACGDADTDSRRTASADRAATTESRSTTAPSSPDRRTPSPPGTSDVVRSYKVTVEGGLPAGGAKTWKVAQGGDLMIVITSDENDEVHLHGYDIERELPAGQIVRMAVHADKNGTFALETHHRKVILGQLVVK